MPFISLSEVIDLYFATLWIKRLHHALHLIFSVLQEKQFPFAFVVGCSSGGPSSEGKSQGPGQHCDHYCHHPTAFIGKNTGHFLSMVMSVNP